MIELVQTRRFAQWLAGLTDRQAARRIAIRLARVEAGNFGDARSVGDGVSELRIDYGPGYRIYFVRSNQTVVVLLCGGDKRSQNRDIKMAKVLAAGLE